MVPGNQPPAGPAAAGPAAGKVDVATSDAATRLARALTVLPDAGTMFLGFRLLTELGRGAFSRVFLARQAELGNRNVALKISVDLFDESHTLAQLQHTNIVPIYSVHSASPLQAICMPYFGRITLADVLAALQGRGVPASGEFLVSMLRGTVLRDAPAEVTAPPDRTDVPLKHLERLSYVQAILWMVGRLAEGLAHAHERGIVHRDLKPANVLISDDGQPMLLDFNLSADLKIRSQTRSQLGGTLPYMAPEHLEAFQNGSRPVDARSDIYSLGVMLYEALTGHLPFAVESGPVSDVVPRLLLKRPGEFVDVRRWNPAVTPAVESIVRRCLEFEPEQRYPSASALAEDIHRHLDNLPLRYASEPSLRERAGKWARRHPRLTSPLTLTALAALALAAVVLPMGWISMRNLEEEAAISRQGERFEMARRALLQAQNIFNRLNLELDLLLLQLHYGESIPRPDVLNEDLKQGHELLALYDVVRNPDWQKLPQVEALPLLERERLRESIVGLLFWSAQAVRHQAAHTADESSRREYISKGRLFNGRAEECYSAEQLPRAIVLQKARLAEAAGDTVAARKAREQAEHMPAQSAMDLYVNAYELAAGRKVREAIAALDGLLEQYPQHFGGQLLLAVSCHNLAEYGRGGGYFERALSAYNTCLARRPDLRAARLERGWLYLKNPGAADWKLARADAEAVLKTRPQWESAHLLRAHALAQEVADKCQEKPSEAVEVKTQDECKRLLRDAVADLTEAIRIRSNDPAMYFMRAGVYQTLGDKKAADDDVARVLAAQPSDAEGWVFRGRARLMDLERLEKLARGPNSKNAAAAKTALAGLDRPRLVDESLKDFARALEFDSRSLSGLYQRGRVLSEWTDRTADALQALTRTVELYPDFLDAHSERGLLLARRLQRVPAYADAIACLDQDPSPSRYYQAARIYSLTAKGLHRDRPHALKLLSFALRNGYGWDRFEHEPDFASIREEKDFLNLVQIAPVLGRGVPPRMRPPGKEADGKR